MSTKILGFIDDKNLKFDEYFEKLCEDLNSRLTLILKLKAILPENALNILYKFIIKPKREFGSVLWGHKSEEFDYNSKTNRKSYN